MKRLKVIMVTVSLIIFAGTVNAQDMELKIGDRLPDFAIEKAINSAGKTLRTSDFKDKLLIVDFWATNCSGCVAALPKMEALQKQFGEKLMVLPVTYEKETPVLTFWKNNKYTKSLSLPSVVEDKKFSSLFKHRSIPHEVWVYKGVVIGITTADYVDEHNIRLVLEGKKVDWPVKNDFYRFDAFREPLFPLDPMQLDTGSTFVKYAAISGYRSGVNSEGLSGGAGIVRDPVKKTIRTFFLNQPIWTSYQLLTQQVQALQSVPLTKPSASGISPNEVAWEVLDRTRYNWNKALGYEQDWVRDNAICYESVNPDTGQTDLDVKRATISDLNRLLGLNVRWEKRVEKVLLLTTMSAQSRPAINPADKTILPNDLVYMLNLQQTNPYVFNEIKDNPKQKLTINIKDWTDITAVQKAIAPYGLALKEEERLVDKLVFAKVDGGMLTKRKM